MGITKSQVRDGTFVARGDGPVDDDPFATLADIFDTELKHESRFDDGSTHRRRGATTLASRPVEEPDFGFDSMERAFQAAFEKDMQVVDRPGAKREGIGSHASRAASGAAATAFGRTGDARSLNLTDEEIDDELETVLRSLSAPARPRDRILVETHSFAPERPVEERLPPASYHELDDFEELIRSELAVIRPAMPAMGDVRRGALASSKDTDDADLGDYSEHDLVSDEPSAVRPSRRSSGVFRRTLMTGASAAVLLLVAGAGYLVWQQDFGTPTGAADGGPLLIKADSTPFKVVPKDPGGRSYPNQNKAVYERVASPKTGTDTPTQQALLKNDEEPIELPTGDDQAYADALPGVEFGDDAEAGKDQTRVTEATETVEEVVLQPRKVKTSVVGPDGTIVPQPEPAAIARPEAAQASKPTLVADVSSTSLAASDAPTSMQTASLRPAAAPAESAPAEQAAVVPAKADGPVGIADTIQVATIAPAKPMQPIEAPASDAAKPVEMSTPVDQPAATEPVQTAAAMPTGGFFVQVSSSPSETDAQRSLRGLGGKYGKVIGGRPVGIQTADIPGKGTYYRVRVAAESRNEANAVCAGLKSAGASCFVTR